MRQATAWGNLRSLLLQLWQLHDCVCVCVRTIYVWVCCTDEAQKGRNSALLYANLSAAPLAHTNNARNVHQSLNNNCSQDCWKLESNDLHGAITSLINIYLITCISWSCRLQHTYIRTYCAYYTSILHMLLIRNCRQCCTESTGTVSAFLGHHQCSVPSSSLTNHS